MSMLNQEQIKSTVCNFYLRDLDNLFIFFLTNITLEPQLPEISEMTLNTNILSRVRSDEQS